MGKADMVFCPSLLISVVSTLFQGGNIPTLLAEKDN